METPPETTDGNAGERPSLTLDIPAVASRRLLLAGSAVTLITATTSLLPAWDAAAAKAGSHPAQGVQKRNQRRRHKRRNERQRRAQGHHNGNGDKRHDDNRPPQLGPRGIKMTVNNETATKFDVKYWLGSLGWDSQESELAAHGTLFAGTEDLHLGIEFLTEKHPFIWVENPVVGTPNTTFQYGGSMTIAGYFGGSVEVNHGTLEYDARTTHRIPFTGSQSYAITVRREWDVPGFKVFTMTIRES